MKQQDGAHLRHLIGLIWTAVGGYVWFQVQAVGKWTGIIRALAILPLPDWAAWATAFAIDVTPDTTSHNLLAFELAIGVGIAGGYLIVLALIRFAANRWKSSERQVTTPSISRETVS